MPIERREDPAGRSRPQDPGRKATQGAAGEKGGEKGEGGGRSRVTRECMQEPGHVAPVASLASALYCFWYTTLIYLAFL